MSMDIYFDPNLVPVIMGTMGEIINGLSEIVEDQSKMSAHMVEGYNGEAADDVGCLIVTMYEHLNSLAGLYGAAYGVAINVMNEAEAFDRWLAAQEKAYLDKLTSQLTALSNGEQGSNNKYVPSKPLNSARNTTY